ncbi:MAG: DUF6454 family protein [Bryobacteraceae bacterium]
MRLLMVALGTVMVWGQRVDTLEAGWKLHATVTVQADLHHVQGIDVEGQMMWVSSVDRKARKGYLSMVELPSGRVVKQVEVQEGERIHPGGIMLEGDSIWIPVAEYDRDGPTTVQRRDKKTLAVLGSFEAPDHIGCIAAGKMGLVGGSWASRTLYGWTRDGRELWKRANPIATEWQDLKMDGELLVGSGVTKEKDGAMDWVSLPDLKLVRSLRAGKTDRGVPYMNEGMKVGKGRLLLLPEDAPSRLFEFRVR